MRGLGFRDDLDSRIVPLESSSLGFGVWGLGLAVWGLGFRVSGLGFRVSGLGSTKDLGEAKAPAHCV